jgi:tRNA (guanine37-N1)-methyltransferase
MKDLKSILEGKLQPQELRSLIKSYDIVGDIAIIRIPESLKSRSLLIAEAIKQTHKHVKAVFQQVSAVSGEFRLRQLELLIGKNKAETIYKEFGCVFKVDLEKCYFSPRLSFERMRIAKLIQPGDIVINMFAGVGTFSIIMAKHGKVGKVYSIDINPDAVNYMKENIRLNRVQDKVIPILSNAEQIIAERLCQTADRVIMPLPEKAYEYLDSAIIALKPSGGWIHYYDFEHGKKGDNPLNKVKVKVSQKLAQSSINFEVVFARIVRATGPNLYQVALDILVYNR